VFGHDDLPVTVGLLVDESFSMRPKRSEVLAAAEVFIGGSNRNDEIFVLNFNDSVNRGLPSGVLFSGDLQKLRGALHHGIPQGKTRLNDAVAEGLNILEKGRYEKKALVLITDGGDTASEHTRRQVMDRLERSTATLYAIGIYDEGDPDRDPAFLKKLCSVSGSEAYFPKPEGTAAVCRRIAADIRARYTVGYIPSRGNGESLRNVRVQAAAQHLGHLRAVTRTRYFHDTGE
jgi:VWFA-related protein